MSPGNQGMGGVRLPDRDWTNEIKAVRAYAHNEITREHDERVAAHLELLAKMNEFGTKLEEHRREGRDRDRRAGRRLFASGGLAAVVVAAIGAVSSVWTKRIEVQAPKVSSDETAQTVSDLRKRLAELDEIVAEHRRALQQRPLVRDPDILTARK